MEIPGPKWPDSCEHKPDEYVGTVNALYRNADGKIVTEDIDVYVYQGHIGQAVCLRYGPGGSNYYSPGTIEMFTDSAKRHNDLGAHRAAYYLLQDKGRFQTTWTPNPKA